MTDLPYAEDISYFKTSQSSPDTWIERACAQIEKLGGTVYTHAFGKDNKGNSAYMLQFEIEKQPFKAIWPVLPIRDESNQSGAKRQAATLLFHDIKAKCLEATVKGAKVAFFEYLLLPDGKTIASEATIEELTQGIPLAITDYQITYEPDSEE